MDTTTSAKLEHHVILKCEIVSSGYHNTVEEANRSDR